MIRTPLTLLTHQNEGVTQHSDLTQNHSQHVFTLYSLHMHPGSSPVPFLSEP